MSEAQGIKQAVIMAGGKGTRLAAITKDIAGMAGGMPESQWDRRHYYGCWPFGRGYPEVF